MPSNNFWGADAVPVGNTAKDFWGKDAVPVKDGASAGAEVVNEAHDDITWYERAAVKNLGRNNAESISFLKTKHPDLAIEERDGDIVMKRPNEAVWRKLDPSTLEFSDITDIASDIGTGAASSAATVAGGFAGGLPGAIAAGGATSAGLEAIRQKLGEWAGVNKPDSTDWGDVGIAGGFGAATPLLFGQGATAGQLAKQSLKTGLSKEAIEDAGRGIISRATPYFAEYGGGVPKETFRALRKYMPEIKEARELGEGGARAQFAEQSMDELKNTLLAHKDTLKQRFTTAFDEAGESVDVSKVLGVIDDKLIQLGEKRATAGVASTDKVIGKLVKFKEDITPTYKVVDDFGTEIALPREKLTAKEATEYLQDLRAKLEAIGAFDNTTGKISFQRVSETNKLAAETMRDAYNAVSKQLDTAMSKLDPALRKDYATFKNIERLWEPNIKTPEKTDKFLRNLNKREKVILNEAVQNQSKLMGKDIAPMMDKMAAFGMYLDPALTPLSARGATSTSRTNALTPLLGSIGYKAAEAIKPGMGFIGAGITGLGTNALFSPAAQYAGVAGTQAAKRGVEKALSYIPLGSYMGVTSPWTFMGKPVEERLKGGK